VIVNTFVFDTTALNHFAKANHLAELRAIMSGDRCIAPAEVFTELAKAVAEYPALGDVSAQDWLESVELEDLQEITEFAKYKGELGGGPEKNIGEAAVLAWVSVNKGIAIIDEHAATTIGERDGLAIYGSLWLIIRACKDNRLDRIAAEGIVDDLIATGMWLPVQSGAALFAWAYEEGFLPS
jgi:predicted nucleic acid-binding protein